MEEKEKKFKEEKINEINNAANTESNSGENVNQKNVNTEKKTDSNKSNSEKNKNNIRMISYPIIIGGVGAFSGFLISKKFEKHKLLLIASGFLLGAGIGYVLYKNKNNF
jgi:F0F1-type ATP synthase assembly protein I